MSQESQKWPANYSELLAGSSGMCPEHSLSELKLPPSDGLVFRGDKAKLHQSVTLDKLSDCHNHTILSSI